MEASLRLILVLLLLLRTSALTASYNQTITGSASYQALTFNITPGYNTLAIELEITATFYSNLLAVVSFSPIPNNLSLQEVSSYFQTNSSQLNFMDLLSSIAGGPQITNIDITNRTTIFITVFNFDLPNRVRDKTYALTFRYFTSGFYCDLCPGGSSLINNTAYPLRCQCQPCPQNYIGSSCQYNLRPLLQGKSTNLDVTASENGFFRILDKGSSILLKFQEVTNTNTVKLYIQYESFYGELAGKLNCYYDGNNLSSSKLVSSFPATVVIPSRGRSALLTFQNTGNMMSSIAFTFAYSQDKMSRQLTIALICIFSALGVISITIIAIRLYRSCKARSMTVSNQSSLTLSQRKILPDQIDIVSPEIAASTFYSVVKSFKIARMQPECSICFDQIMESQIARITYCRHIFHSECLKKWFESTEKCPDCNTIFNSELLTEISKEREGKNNIFNQFLVKEYCKTYKSQQLNANKPKSASTIEQKSMQILKIEDIESQQATQL